MKPASALLAVLLAGCFGGSELDDSPVGGVVPVLLPEVIDVSGMDCDGLAMFLFVEPSRVTPWLPGGYHARDGSALFGLPAASGKVPVMLAATRCPEYPPAAGNGTGPWATGAVSIFVETPAVDETVFARNPANFHFYSPMIYTDSAAWFDQLAPYETDAQLVPMDFVLPFDPLGPMGVPHTVSSLTINGTTASPTDLDYQPEASFVVTSPVPLLAAAPNSVLADWHLRAWNQNEVGLTVIDYRFDSDVLAGSVTCILRDGSVAGQMSQSAVPTDQCAPSLDGVTPGYSFGASFQSLDLTGVFYSFPGESVV